MILFQNLNYFWSSRITFLQEDIFKNHTKHEELKANKGLFTVESENTR